MNGIIKLDNISKVFLDGDRSVEVLKSVSMEIKRGEFVAIVGPSGSGKSTLLSIMGALLTPSSGSIVLSGQEVTNARARQLKKIRKHKLGFIFQTAHLIPYLTVQEQLLLVAEIVSKRDREQREKAAHLINDLGLAHRENSRVDQLSGGEKQRVAIARAFMNDPDCILADEPTASLDSEKGRRVVKMLRKEVKNRQKSAVMVTHDERMLDLCDRVLYLEDGMMYEERKIHDEKLPLR
ncbi:ABC transporter ATP-binding protein [Sediminibacillus halophilus]|uniref:Putative hemin import ATP-binding protein HrtA n=1 Tax=Sediminibacillus halophilus TaxID=482461 RepID=A0A1G9NE39_9BACI|nr:ABC transporter ATP-binding protein [Sediminibacillus halophilus]SDL84730.1 putative ABC transport system ATP-binding protein [Sediminibacillus halophilus]